MRHEYVAIQIPGLAVCLLTPAASAVVLLGSAVSAQQAAQIVGVVRDTSGVPIPNASVTLPDVRQDLRTSVDGTFRVSGLVPGVYTLNIRAIGFIGTTEAATLDTGVTSIVVELSRSFTRLPAVVSKATRRGLSGIVQDSSGTPVAGAEVRANGGTTVVDHFR